MRSVGKKHENNSLEASSSSYEMNIIQIFILRLLDDARHSLREPSGSTQKRDKYFCVLLRRIFFERCE